MGIEVSGDKTADFQKSALNFDSTKQDSPLQARWGEIQTEIELGIAQGTYTAKKYTLVGHRGEPIVKSSRRGRRPQFINSAAFINVRRNPEEIVYEEAEDVRRVIDQFVSPGDSVCKILGGYEVTAISSLLGQVGPEGKVYYITAARNLRKKLFQNLFELFVNLREIKGEPNTVSFRREKLPSPWAEDVTRLLAVPFLVDTELYQDRYVDKKDKLLEAFYQNYPLIPIDHKIPPFPNGIESGSFDAIMELDRFSGVPIDKKGALVLEMDRLLKPGGILLIREGTLSQTEIQYYGEDIFTGSYTWKGAARLKHPNRWMLLRKNLSGAYYPSVWVPNGHIEKSKPNQVCKKDHVWESRAEVETENEYSKRLYLTMEHMLTIKHEVNGETFDPHTIDETLKEQLSLRWFKSVGLLAPLLTDFGGSIDKAVDFVLFHNQPKNSVFGGKNNDW